MFHDRDDAAKQLAERLLSYREQNPLVLAIPRGAVPMAKIISEKLQGDMDIVLVRKLGAPGNPELAIGSVDETGWTYLTKEADLIAHDPQYIESEKKSSSKSCSHGGKCIRRFVHRSIPKDAL